MSEKIKKNVGRPRLYATDHAALMASRERVRAREVTKQILLIRERMIEMSDIDYLTEILLTKTDCNKVMRRLDQISEFNSNLS